MKILLCCSLLFACFIAKAQEERDTVLKRCPVFITDTSSVNNFFLEFQPATLKVARVHGDLTISIQQKDQFFTLFFSEKKLRNKKYRMMPGAHGKSEVAAKYSFRSGEQVSFVDVRSGTIESSFDETKNMWHLKINGMIANMVERAVTYYRVKAELEIR